MDPSLRTQGDNRWRGSDEQQGGWGAPHSEAKPQSHTGITCIIGWDHLAERSFCWEISDHQAGCVTVHVSTCPPLHPHHQQPGPRYHRFTSSLNKSHSLLHGTTASGMVPRLPSTLHHPHSSQHDLLKLQTKLNNDSYTTGLPRWREW